jgi:hypothetical protein
MSKKGVVNVPNGIFKDGKGGTLTLPEALDELAKCCGVDCCNNHIRLPDQTTGTRTDLYFEDGVLKYNIDGEVYTVALTSDIPEPAPPAEG